MKQVSVRILPRGLYRLVLAFALLVFVSASGRSADSPAAADTQSRPDVHQLIANMNTVARQTNYIGNLFYQYIYRSGRARGVHQRSMMVIRKVKSGKVHERIIGTDGEPYEIIRNPSGVYLYYKNQKRVIVTLNDRLSGLSALPGFPYEIPSMSPHYDFSLVSEGRTADRTVWIVQAIPQDTHRYGHTFWIDKETNILLKSELRNRAGRILKHLNFVNIDIGHPVPESELQVGFSTEGFSWEHSDNHHGSDRPSTWLIDWLPEGFDLIFHEYSDIEALAGNVEHRAYSDGLATITVFFSAQNKQNVVPGNGVTLGTIGIYSTLIEGHKITLMGEVPMDTLKNISEKIAYQP